jgi:hypothetical protein
MILINMMFMSPKKKAPLKIWAKSIKVPPVKLV